MSFSNTTPNYGLPQYVAEDKPTYLGDFNKAMLDIDTNLKNNSDNVNSIESSVNSANEKSSQALQTATDASTNANNALTLATQVKDTTDNLQTQVSNAVTDANNAVSTSTQALSKASTAETNANIALNNSNTNKSNINSIMSWTQPNNIAGNRVTDGELMLSYNNGIKLLTLYGAFTFTASQGTNTIAHLPQALIPSENRTVYNAGQTNTGGVVNLTFTSDGKINYTASAVGVGETKMRMNCTINWSFWK